MFVKNVLILGIGGIGYHIAKRLTHEGYSVICVETNQELVRYANENLDCTTFEGSALDATMWRKIKDEKIDLIIAATDDDAVNMIAAQVAEKLGIRLKIARTRSIDFGGEGCLLTSEELSIDLVVHPEELVAQEIADLIHRASGNDVIDIADNQMKVLGIRVKDGSSLVKKRISEIAEIYNSVLFRIVAIGRGITTIIPGGQNKILVGDQVFILAANADIPQVMKIFGVTQNSIHRIMILGGGTIGYRIAQLLEKKVQIKIIESNEKRAEELASALRGTTVLHGDGTDANVLAMAGILDMDTFIATTGDNETNIISCLLAKHLINRQNVDPNANPGKTIAIVDKEDYLVLASTIGLDVALNAKISAANEILKFIRRSELLSVAHLHGVDVEVVELVAGHNSPITKKPLFKQKSILENGSILVGGFYRDNCWHVAEGKTQISNGERVIVVCTSLNLKKIRKLFH